MNKNIFLLDIETNNKDIVMDFTNPFNAEIIDRFIYEYNFNTVISDGLIKNKFPLTTSHINGITEKDLLDAEPNYDKFKDDINKILKYCDKPIFIAHNGNRFDFPMLFHHEIVNQNKISTIDTLYLFRLYYKDKNISNKLIDIYNKICDKNITQVHRAKEDTLLIVEILKKLNLSVNDLNNIIKQ
jgi:DNA polymerase III epsilon subunit-like protein